jgi:DNA-binding cell septation regulator SpoVG
VSALILPYGDETRWAHEHVNLQQITMVNSAGKGISSLKVEGFNQLYKLKPSQMLLNSQFIDTFHQLNSNLLKVIKQWYLDEWEFKERVGKTYPTYLF